MFREASREFYIYLRAANTQIGDRDKLVIFE